MALAGEELESAQELVEQARQGEMAAHGFYLRRNVISGIWNAIIVQSMLLLPSDVANVLGYIDMNTSNLARPSAARSTQKRSPS